MVNKLLNCVATKENFKDMINNITVKQETLENMLASSEEITSSAKGLVSIAKMC